MGVRIVTIAITAAVIGGGLLSPALADARPSYSFCPPNVDPDCYFVYIVNAQLFPVAPGDIDGLINRGLQACAEMTDDGTSLAVINWARRFTAENGLSGNDATRGVDHDALEFAHFSATAYCPWVLPTQ